MAWEDTNKSNGMRQLIYSPRGEFHLLGSVFYMPYFNVISPRL